MNYELYNIYYYIVGCDLIKTSNLYHELYYGLWLIVQYDYINTIIY